MAPTLEVEIRDLVTMTNDLAEVGTTFAGIKTLVSDTRIATSNWPAAGWHAADAYKSASSTAEQAAGAVSDASKATALNLDAVARHYAGAEYHSSITPSAPSNVGSPNSGSRLTLNNGARLSMPVTEGAIAILLVLAQARSSVKASARATGLLPYFLAVDATTIEPNIRESGPFREARDTWRSIADIKPLLSDLDALVPLRNWEGDAASGFDAHMLYNVLPVLDRFVSVAESMGDLCDEMAKGMDEINHQWLALLIKTSIHLLALNLIPLPYRLVFSIAAATLFATNVAILYWKMRSWYSAKSEAVHSMAAEAGALAVECFDETQTLDANRNLLNPRFTMVSDEWSAGDWLDNWRYKADA
ncbi:hypothetical protein [Actinomadura sp. DC4]|uniref:hypothetical protein n=1 Tax=Actinomadura sp. DC4 TaxID=3055069 RepID=UPI0025B19DC8|nr:hypothetical protein [Actinomadura sp. DC4]MDN3351331.1 hypothetical protein [Actinomadura sp. DC4]